MSDEAARLLARYGHGARQNGDGGEAGSGALAAAEGFVAMLDLQLATGDRVALPYATLLKAAFNPSEGIKLTYSTDDVVISGRRLEPLYKAITQHRARIIKSVGSAGEFETTTDQPVVTSIEILPPAGKAT